MAKPPWRREPGSSPQRGEAGREAERCKRCSPQPSTRLAPHTDGMNIRLFLGGLRPPKPSHRVGYGETRPPPASLALVPLVCYNSRYLAS